MIKHIILTLTFVFYAQTATYLCCLASSGGLGSLTLSPTPCTGIYQDCHSWENTKVQWNQIQGIPACLSNCYYPNRLLQQQTNFQPYPILAMILGIDVNGVYGIPDANSLNGKVWLHNQTFPQLFNQDIILKNLIDDLKSQINQNKPLTYLNWIWTLLTLTLCIGWLIFKLVKWFRARKQETPEEKSAEQRARRKRIINTEMSVVELNQSIGFDQK